jgi:hypothetical protein
LLWKLTSLYIPISSFGYILSNIALVPNIISTATQLYSSIYKTHLCMLCSSTVRVVINHSTAKRLLISISKTCSFMLHSLSVRLAINSSAAMKL